MRYGALVLWTCWVFQPAQGRRNIRPPHFASKVSYSASPQSFVAPYYLAKKRSFFKILYIKG